MGKTNRVMRPAMGVKRRAVKRMNDWGPIEI